MADAYATGNGSFTLRAKIHIEEGSVGTGGSAKRGTKAPRAAAGSLSSVEEEGEAGSGGAARRGGGGGGKSLIVVTELPYQVCKVDQRPGRATWGLGFHGGLWVGSREGFRAAGSGAAACFT